MTNRYREIVNELLSSYEDRNFCCVVALAAACDVTTEEAYNALQKVGRKHKSGCWEWQLLEAAKLLGYKLQWMRKSKWMCVKKLYPGRHKELKHVTMGQAERFPDAWQEVFGGKKIVFGTRGHVAAWNGFQSAPP